MPVGADDHIGPKNVGILGRCASIDPYNCVVYDSAVNDNLSFNFPEGIAFPKKKTIVRVSAKKRSPFYHCHHWKEGGLLVKAGEKIAAKSV